VISVGDDPQVTGDDQERVNSIVAALADAAREEEWPEHLQLRDALDELERWVGEDHQWGAPRSARHWGSLIRDVIDALADLGPSTQVALDAQTATAELQVHAAAFEAKAEVTEATLRERLAKCAEAMTVAAASSEALLAAWCDLVACARDRKLGEKAGRSFLSLASWNGHDADWFARNIRQALDGSDAMRIDGELVTPATGTPLAERLAAARPVVGEPPRKLHLTVWLRLRPAQIRWPPWIAIGDDVRLYQGSWLRSCLCAPMPHQDLPPEAAGDGLAALRDFCGVQAVHVEAGGQPHDPHEPPVAYIRVVVGEQLTSRAVDIARSNAEAIAALGALYGEEPTIWRLDRSYVVFCGTHEAGHSIEAEEPEWTESLVASEDRTGDVIQTLSDRLAGHVPFHDDELERAMAMFGWLRGARSSPPAARLVLCDRVIEAVCGWAGRRNRKAFVRDQLLPWWGLARLEFLVRRIAHRLYYGYPSPRLPPDHPAWTTWQEILDHKPLGLRAHSPKYKTSTLAAETPWLLERVPGDTLLGQALQELHDQIQTGAVALSSWESWQKRGEGIEDRRARTRNAIMHGGPLSPATVDRVVLFAESLATLALASSLNAKLAGKSIAAHFSAQQARANNMRKRLELDHPQDPPAEVLFGGDPS